MIKNKVDAFVEFTDPIRARYEVPRDYYNTNYPEYQRHGKVNFLPNGIQLKDSYREAVPYYRMQVTSKSLPIKLFDTVPIVLEMDIKIQSMPIYHQCYHTEKAAYGLSIVLSDVMSSVVVCLAEKWGKSEASGWFVFCIDREYRNIFCTVHRSCSK